VNLKGPPETSQTHSPHELEAGQPCQVLGVPFPQLTVFGVLADDRVLDDGVAEVINDRRDGENAAQSLIQSFFRGAFLSRVAEGFEPAYGGIDRRSKPCRALQRYLLRPESG
jgi:hypothetical protein